LWEVCDDFPALATVLQSYALSQGTIAPSTAPHGGGMAWVARTQPVGAASGCYAEEKCSPKPTPGGHERQSQLDPRIATCIEYQKV